MDYTREYSPVPVTAVGEAYAHFQLGNPYVRSSPAGGDSPSPLPPTVAPPPYSKTNHSNTTTTTDLNGGVNGRLLNSTSNGKIASGNCVNGTLKHALLHDLKQEFGREASQDLDSAVLHSKFIISPQTKIKPGTLV